MHTRVAGAAHGHVVVMVTAPSHGALSSPPPPKKIDGSPATQINKIVAHPTMPLAVAALENAYINFYDSATGTGRACEEPQRFGG